jgi:hypothetical protein
MRSHGRIPYAGFDIGGVSRACGGAWRLVELCFSCCLSAGLEDRDGRALANKSNQSAWVAVDAIDEEKMCYRNSQ